MNIFFYKKKVIATVLVLFGISSVFLFQNCSEIKPLTSEGEFIPDPGDQGNGSGDNNGDGGDSGDTGGGNNGGGNTSELSSFNNCVLPGVGSFSTDLSNTSLERPVGYELVKPRNFTAYQRTWASQFNGFTWPHVNSQLAPIGSWSALVTGAWSGRRGSYPRDTRAAGMYIAIPFTVTADQARDYEIQVREAQPLTGVYNMSRVAGEVTMTISPCAGDFRPRSLSAPDIYAKYCRTSPIDGTVTNVIFTVSTTPNPNFCTLTPGNYWLNITMARSSAPDFITGTRNGCADLDHDGQPEIEQCEANMRLKIQSKSYGT